MLNYSICLNLESETIFGSGEGVAGLVDVEVQHDKAGCPYLNGRALRGLLVEECANLLFALQKHPRLKELQDSAQHLFGMPGSTHAEQSQLNISDATLPKNLREAIWVEISNNKISRQEILEAFTVIRYQTAVNDETGAPKDKSLRSMRAILRETTLQSDIIFSFKPEGSDLPLLAACIASLRQAGLGRNRGKGRLTATLLNESSKDVTPEHLDEFIKMLGGAV